MLVENKTSVQYCFIFLQIYPVSKQVTVFDRHFTSNLDSVRLIDMSMIKLVIIRKTL